MRGGDVLPKNDRRLRARNLSLALFVFVVTSFVHLAHNPKADFPFLFRGNGPGSFYDGQGSTPAPALARCQVCLACLLIDGFQTVRISVFFLLLCLAGLLGGYVQHRIPRRSIDIRYHFLIRGPPLFTPSF